MTARSGCKYFISKIFLIIFFFSWFHLYFCENANAQKLSRGIEYLNEGIENYENGRYEYAIINLNRALNELPEGDRENLWKVHFYLGLSYYLMGESKEAKKEFANAHAIIRHKMPDPEIYSPKIVKLFKEMATFAVARPGKTWREPVTGMEFVWVFAGCYEMGQTEAGRRQIIEAMGEERDRKWYLNELPRHEVCVDGFWMGRYEVTNAQYRKFKSGHDSGGYKGLSLNGDSQPAVGISWKDAKAFAKWLTRRSGGRYEFRLPTEAEWEYGARGGTKTARYWGDDPDDACKYANVADRTAKRNWPGWTIHNCDDGHAVTAPVGSFQPNAFGLYDMLGNIWECCEDIYDKNSYRKHQRNNPIYTGGFFGGGSSPVIRGGGWRSRPRRVRRAHRGDSTPVPWRDDLGFRLLRTP